MRDDNDISLRNWVVFGFLALVWGSSFILIEQGLTYFSAMEVACLRVSISMMAFLPFVPRAMKCVRRKHLKGVIGMGLLGNLFPAFLFAYAQTGIDSSIAGILNALTPIFTMLLGAILFRQGLRMLKIAGVVTGFAGAAIIVWKGMEAGSTNFYLMELLVILATFCYGLSSNIIKAWLGDISAREAGAVAFLIIGPVALTILLVFTGFTDHVMHSEAIWPLFSIVLLALLGTVLATILYIRLLQDTNALFGTSVTYLIPVVAIFWGWFYGDQLFAKHLLGLILILMGVYLISWRKKSGDTI